MQRRHLGQCRPCSAQVKKQQQQHQMQKKERLVVLLQLRPPFLRCLRSGKRKIVRHLRPGKRLLCASRLLPQHRHSHQHQQQRPFPDLAKDPRSSRSPVCSSMFPRRPRLQLRLPLIRSGSAKWWRAWRRSSNPEWWWSRKRSEPGKQRQSKSGISSNNSSRRRAKPRRRGLLLLISPHR